MAAKFHLFSCDSDTTGDLKITIFKASRECHTFLLLADPNYLFVKHPSVLCNFIQLHSLSLYFRSECKSLFRISAGRTHSLVFPLLIATRASSHSRSFQHLATLIP